MIGTGMLTKTQNLTPTNCNASKMSKANGGSVLVGVVKEWSHLRAMKGEGTHAHHCLDGMEEKLNCSETSGGTKMTGQSKQTNKTNPNIKLSTYDS